MTLIRYFAYFTVLIFTLALAGCDCPGAAWPTRTGADNGLSVFQVEYNGCQYLMIGHEATTAMWGVVHKGNCSNPYHRGKP